MMNINILGCLDRSYINRSDIESELKKFYN